MSGLHTIARQYWRFFAITAVATLFASPVGTARADDDWDDDIEDYYEELEERREEARERWEDWREDERERWEEWREDRDDWRERRGRRYFYGPAPEYRFYREPRYYRYDPSPTYRYYRAPAPEYYYYESYSPPARYYGTPDIGYTEFGRERSVQVGPFRMYWYR